MRRQPQVRTGAIGPEADPHEQPSQDLLAAAVAQAKEARAAAPEEVVFHAKARNYMFQVTAPAPIFDPASGRILEARPKVAKFQNSEYRTKDAEVIAIMKNDRSYGIGRDFWDAAELATRAAVDADARLEAQVREKLKSDPAFLTRLAPDVESFAVPQP